MDVAVPDQVIKVPKIFVDATPLRRLCRDPQMAEQLVVVPTPSPALVPSPRMEDQLVEVPPIVPQLVPSLAGADGYVWRQLSGPTGAYWWRVGPSHTQWARHRGTPPGQGGIEILAAATLAGVAVVDVLVNMQHMFQQSLDLQFSSSSVVAIPVATHRQFCTALLCRRPLRFHSCSSWSSLSFPVFCNDKFWYKQCRKQWSCRRCSSLWCCRRHCDHTARSSSPSRSFLARFSSFDRVLDIPVVPQQFLNKCVDACAHGVDSARQLRSPPTRSLTSLFSRTEVEVPQIQSSTQFGCRIGCFSTHFAPFSDSPERG